MELIIQTSPALLETKNYSGSGTYDVSAGKTLKVETGPQGDEILSITVPEGKKWRANVTISIVETDE